MCLLKRASGSVLNNSNSYLGKIICPDLVKNNMSDARE